VYHAGEAGIGPATDGLACTTGSDPQQPMVNVRSPVFRFRNGPRRTYSGRFIFRSNSL
jgi:hypothetical protein